MSNGIQLILTGPSGKARKLIVKQEDLRGTLWKFFEDEGV